MNSVKDLTSIQPYGSAALAYVEAGWPSVIPTKVPREKYPPLDGYTGYDAAVPTPDQVSEWATSYPDSNVLLRMPENVIGIDVDAYGDKHGDATLAELESQYGELTETWRSTSRGDGPSGIRFYRVPDGFSWPSTLGPGIEVVQSTHRYAVVAPSVHPEERQYEWIKDGQASNTTPGPFELAELPSLWVKRLCLPKSSGPSEVTSDDISQFLSSTAENKEAPTAFRTLVAKYKTNVKNGASRHDEMNSLLRRAMEESYSGLYPALDAISAAQEAFLASLGEDQERKRGAKGEIKRSITWAIARALEKTPDQLATIAAKVKGKADEYQKGSEPVERRLKFKFQKFSDLVPTKRTWLIDRYLPDRGLVLLAGSRGVGKSTLFAKWAVDLENGTMTGQQEKVLYMSTEDDPADILLPRFYVANSTKQPEEIYTLTMTESLGEDGTEIERRVNFHQDLENLRGEIQKLGITKIFLDPINTFLGVDEEKDSSSSIRLRLEKLKAFADSEGVLVFGMKHFKKAQSTSFTLSGLDRIYGSGAWTEVPRYVLGMVRVNEELREKLSLTDDDEAGCLLSVLKNSYVDLHNLPAKAFKFETVTYTLGGQINESMAKLVDDGERNISTDEIDTTLSEDKKETAAKRTASAKTDAWLVSLLHKNGGTMPIKDVETEMKKSGICSRRTLMRRAEFLGIESRRIEGSDKNAKEWLIPPALDVQAVVSGAQGGTQGQSGASLGGGPAGLLGHMDGVGSI